MTHDEPPTTDPHPTDPRLRSFLRKASAIIATEKGLNATSQAKLQSLADHLLIPKPLFDQAINQLHSHSGVPAILTRYEKAFIEFLASEFDRLQGDVLSPEMENKAIELARDKYQISETRAEQLIQTQTTAKGISRISSEEAQRFGDNTIVNQIGAATELEQDAWDSLVKAGKAWGLDSAQVQQIILQQLNRNRQSQTSHRKQGWRWALAGSVLLVVGFGLAVSQNWFPSAWQTRNPPPTAPQPERRNSPPESIPPWISESTVSALNELCDFDSHLKPTIDRVLNVNPDQRRQGLQELAQTACKSQERLRDTIIAIAPSLYYQDPSDETVIAFIETLGQQLRSPNDKEHLAVEDLRRAYRANRLLGTIYCFDTEKNDLTLRRRQTVNAIIQSHFGIQLTNIPSHDIYSQKSESALAGDHWNQIARMAWIAPSRAAQLVSPLVDLTRDKIDPMTLDQYRNPTVLAIMESDPSHWNKILPAIQATIASCNETNLIQWIDIFSSSRDEALQQSIRDNLLARIDTQPGRLRPSEAHKAIVNFGMQYRYRILSPALNRSKSLDTRVATLLALPPADPASTPDRIARIAIAVNIEMAFCSAIENASHIDDSSFAEFDRLATNSQPVLRDVISLSIDRPASKAPIRSPPTASDNRKKDSALNRLLDRSPASSTLRQLALSQLARIAYRFDDLTYRETEILADYFLTKVDTKERLNIERLAGSFSHWPNLAMALADNLPTGTVDQNQTVAIASLLLHREMKVGTTPQWKHQLAIDILANVQADLVQQANLDPQNTQSNWERLKLFLIDTNRQRLAMHQVQNPPQRTYTLPHQPTVDLAQALNRRHDFAPWRFEFDRAAKMVPDISSNEIEQAVLANQLLIRVLANRISSSPSSAETDTLINDLQTSLQRETMPGDQLLATEVALLGISILRRKSLTQRLLNGKF